jgi:hypothetical protein
MRWPGEETNRPIPRPTVYRDSTGGAVNHTSRLTLDVVSVREPCPADWDEMTGDERERFCAGCGLYVHNLSAMTRTEAERLVCESAGRLCIRYEQDARGGVRTLEYARPEPRRGWRFWSVLGVLGAIAASAAGMVWDRSRQAQQRGVIMGSMACPVSPPPPPAAGSNPAVPSIASPAAPAAGPGEGL